MKAESKVKILPKSGHTNTVFEEYEVYVRWFDAINFQFVPSTNSMMSPATLEKLWGFFNSDVKQVSGLDGTFWQWPLTE
jgi:hypothetical protein